MVGNGDWLICNNECSNVQVTLDNMQFIIDFYTYMVFLGSQWLKTLGSVFTDYCNLTMQFKWKGQEVMLKGIIVKYLQVN